MKQTFLIASLFLLLVACGEQEPASSTVEQTAVVEQQPADVAADAVAQAEDDVAVATEEVVEESAAEPESGEQEIVLALADAPTATQNWQFKEGQHYVRMVPTQPTLGGADKIEVAEFFWYGCGHCYTFEPLINPWADNKPANVRFVRIPATWNNLLLLHGRLYYTEEVLARNGVIKDPAAFRDSIFQEYHRRRNQMGTEDAIRKVFVRLGVSADDFDRTWKSFEVDQKLRVAADLARRYSISGVPAIIVNGKYRSSGKEAGSYPKLLEVIDELVARESAR